MKIAFLACPATLPGSPMRRSYAAEHDRYVGALRAGIGDRGTVTEIDWRAPLDMLARFDLAILGTPWDYPDAKDEFLARLGELEAIGVTVCNPLEVVRWNADKLYLKELAEGGAVTIPTLWPERAGPQDVLDAFDHFGTSRVVAKRRVGAGAMGQDSFTRDNPPPADWSIDQPAMIQPFLPAILTEGEQSFVFIDGRLSHCLLKRPKAGDYRIQALYGGVETPLDPAPEDHAAAEACLSLLPFDRPPLYARIDMVRLEDGRLAVIEAELIEPYLYPEQGPNLGRLLADGIIRRIG